MIVIDLVMINLIENLLHVQIIHLAQSKIQHRLEVNINLILVLATSPPVLLTPLSDAINYLIVLPPNHVLIATGVDITLLQRVIRPINTNPR